MSPAVPATCTEDTQDPEQPAWGPPAARLLLCPSLAAHPGDPLEHPQGRSAVRKEGDRAGDAGGVPE